MLICLDLTKPVSCAMFGRMMQHNGWHRKYTHTNHNHLLVFVISGSAVFYIQEKPYPAQAGDVLVIPAGIPYSANTDARCQYYFFRFEAELRCAGQPCPTPQTDRSFSFTVQQVPHRTVQFSVKTALQDEYQKFYQSIISCVEYNTGGTFSQRMALDLELYEAFASGFIPVCAEFCTKEELDSLALGALTMTFELVARFLEDYVRGDKYFRIHHPGHNLERGRSQLALALDMKKKFDRMQEINRRYINL